MKNYMKICGLKNSFITRYTSSSTLVHILLLSNTLAKSDSTNGHGMRRISFIPQTIGFSNLITAVSLVLISFYPRMPQVLMIAAPKTQPSNRLFTISCSANLGRIGETLGAVW